MCSKSETLSKFKLICNGTGFVRERNSKMLEHFLHLSLAVLKKHSTIRDPLTLYNKNCLSDHHSPRKSEGEERRLSKLCSHF